ncbi:MAG: GNAT family N-acetyltransferase [Actinomycetota bacterium]
MTSTTAVRPQELTAAQLQRWRELLLTNDELRSPYFHPEYVMAVAEVRDDVYVGVFEADGGEAFLPFQLGRFGVAGPVGGGFSDYQAVIAPAGVTVDVAAVVADLDLRLLDFDHQLATQTWFAPYARAHHTSPYLDLADGFEAYVAARKAAGSSRLSQFQRKGRKLGRERGELRLVYSDADADMLDQVIAWKRAQCVRTRATDFFAWDWTNGIVQRIHRTKTDGFAGILTALYAGDDLVAAHFGIRTDRVLHWWFPTYDRDLGSYSPGGVMLTLLAERAAAEGIEMLDLGRGGDVGYKASFASGAIPLLEGSVGPRSAVSVARDLRRGGEYLLRDAPALEPARSVARRARNRIRPTPTD